MFDDVIQKPAQKNDVASIVCAQTILIFTFTHSDMHVSVLLKCFNKVLLQSCFSALLHFIFVTIYFRMHYVLSIKFILVIRS